MTEISTHVRHILQMAKQNMDEVFEYLDAAFENLPKYPRLLAYIGDAASKPTGVDGIIKKHMLRAELSELSFNVEYEIDLDSVDPEEDDTEEDDDDDAFVTVESGFKALSASAQSLGNTLLYLYPIKDELPEIVSEAMTAIWPLYETNSPHYYSGHWWIAGKFSEDDNMNEFYLFLFYLYRLKIVIEQSLK